jgi:broad specificity phosphatase PhoE
VDSHRLLLATDAQLIEADNVFEGKKVSIGDGALRSPKHWPHLHNPFRPSWGEPYLHVARRMLGAVYRARAAAEGHEAVCVSHQLPIWTLRRFMEGKRLWHDPRRRECSLASLTSLLFDDETLVAIRYTEPAGASSPKVTGA